MGIGKKRREEMRKASLLIVAVIVCLAMLATAEQAEPASNGMMPMQPMMPFHNFMFNPYMFNRYMFNPYFPYWWFFQPQPQPHPQPQPQQPAEEGGNQQPVTAPEPVGEGAGALDPLMMHFKQDLGNRMSDF